MHWQQGGERKVEKSCCIPGTYPKSQGGACVSFAFLAFGGCGLLYENDLTGFGLPAAVSCVFPLRV
jgi:hypothetical protein